VRAISDGKVVAAGVLLGLLLASLILLANQYGEARDARGRVERVEVAETAARRHLVRLLGQPPSSLVCQNNPHLYPTERCDAIAGGRVLRLLCDRGACTLMGDGRE
jgi:hypothetical protein